ncbi:MAG: hypothetical protein AAF171_03260 [Cyanobacteria bacterium P01_A01_bin.116]
MIEIARFDIKTGKPIQESLEGRHQPAIKQVEHAYLEHWLRANGLEAQLSVAKFYESVNDSDRLRLEAEDKVLAFSSGSDGYFTDFTTAQLMMQGNETVAPIYADDRNSPHNAVAYGGLIASDGVASTTISSARILVIDDEHRTHGSAQLQDSNGRAVPAQQLESLYDKMGDGTMLVSEGTMRALQTVEEREQIASRAAEKSGVSGDISSLVQELSQADEAIAIAERQEKGLARRSVVQFRAASPDLPGIAKGTMASSRWCDRLGVDAIISSNDIKGDDGRLSALGVKEVSDFWVNRKSTGQYGQQSVGPQVKYTIPEATRLEINPKVEAQAEELAKVTGDFTALSQRYVEQKERERSRPYKDLEEDSVQSTRPDWLYDTLSADKYGQLTGQAKVVDGLSRYVRGEWVRLATNGTSVPSAMAQHHSQLKPWEVCNKDLPHGAIVAYYRSPFPNVGAAAIAINNTDIIREKDREAFSKNGVAYLPPWTAKNVAITDFDGDMNGFFVGYQATVQDLPQQIRDELVSVQSLPPEQQYESGRVLFERMIHQFEKGEENRITPDEYPVAVKEFTERNAPEVRPPEIIKQKKEKHPWQEEESHSAATWRAWETTADNPTGKVANAGMSLQALALEMEYSPADRKESLLDQVSIHCSKLLEKEDAGIISIPGDDWLTSQKFSPFYRERMEVIAEASEKLNQLAAPASRLRFTESRLQMASTLFFEVANGPNAVNLQTAVDMAKSSKGIDEELHKFVVALQYKPDVFRKNKNNPEVYVGGKGLPTNTEEPVAWGIQSVNTAYSDAQLEERLHQDFQALFPKAATNQQEWQTKAIIQNYNGLMAKAVKGKVRLQQRRPEDRKPTLEVALPDGRQFILQNIRDEQGTLPIWRAEGMQPDWKIRVSKDNQAKSAAGRFPAELSFVDSEGVARTQAVGYVSQSSVLEHGLEQRLQLPNKTLSVSAPSVTSHVPWAQQNDTDMLFDEANRYIEEAISPPPEKDIDTHRQELATALWRQHSGRHIVMKQFPEVLGDRLRHVPEIQIGRLQISSAVGQEPTEHNPHTIRFGKDVFPTKAGEEITLSSVSVMQPDGQQRLVGAVAARSVALPEGATYMAAFSKNAKSDRVIDMRVMDLPVIAQAQSEVAAMREGRRHLTFDFEPHADYGIREGDIVIAQAEQGGEQIALRVGGQHLIDEQLAVKHSQRWSEVEKAPPEKLMAQLSAASSKGKALWGMNVEALGTYRQGQITSFPMAEQAQQTSKATVSERVVEQPDNHHAVSTVLEAPQQSQPNQPPQEISLSRLLWDRYSSQNSGVLAGVAAGNSSIQRSLDQAIAKQAIQDGHSVKDVEEAIAQHSPLAQQSSQPETYAKAAAEQAANSLPKKHSQVQHKARAITRRMKANDNGLS